MNRFLKSIALVLLILSACAPLRSMAKGEWPQVATLNREQVLANAADVTTNTYPNANTVLLDNHVYVRYEADGSYQTWDDEYVKILTEKGRRESQQRSLQFDIHYGDSKPVMIEIIKFDGKTVSVDVEQQSRIMTDPSQMGSNIYNPSDKVMIVTIPNLEVGDICHYRTYSNIFKARMANTFSDYTVLEYTSPIKCLVYEIDGPKDAPLRSVALKAPVGDSVEHTVQQHGDRIIYRWVTRDVPRMYEEPKMPSYYTVVQRLLASTIPDWITVSKWYWNLSKPRLEATTPDMRAKVDELIDGADNDMDKVRRIFKFVSQQIRYMGITTEEEAPGYEPHDVSITFKNRYGVCRDKAALLVAMLRMAGLEGYPVLINVGPKKDKEVPQPYFNHAIVAVELTPGEYTLMDPTNENTRDLLPRYLCDKSYLVAKPEGETLKTSPIIPAEQNMLRIKSEGTLAANGELKVDSWIFFEGVNDSVYRGYFARQKPEDLRRFFEKIIRRGVPGARLESIEINPDNLRNTEAPLEAQLSFSSSDCLTGNSDPLLFEPPWIGRGIGMANIILRGTGLEKRKYPLMTDIACGVAESFSIDTSDAELAPVQTKSHSALDLGKCNFENSIDFADNTISGHSSLRLEAVEYLPKEYQQLKDLLEQRELAWKSRPLFRSLANTTQTPDVLILNRSTELDLQDKGVWSERVKQRKKILTYAGKKDNSEMKLDYNPAWQTLKLEYARVIQPDGSVSKISNEELNLMDAPWVASAPRYPASKRLVASLPGVEVGSIIESSVLIENHDKPFFSRVWSPNGYNPVEENVLRITNPDSMPLATLYNKLGHPGKVDMSSTDGKQTHEWRFKSLAGLKQEDNMPPWYAFNPAVFMSTGNWKNYAGEVGKHLRSSAHDQKNAQSIARKIIKGVKNDEQKIRTVRDYVAKNISPAGPALTQLPLSAITTADETIASGYGNTSDRAVVLFAMLKAAGLNPEFILASSNAPRVKDIVQPLIDLPQRWMYNTVLVRVDIDGDHLYLNDSNQYDAVGATSFELRPGLTLAGKPLVIEPRTGYVDRSDAEYTIDLDANGDAKMKYERRYYGNAYGDFHKRYAEMPPEERRRHFQEMVSAVSEAATPLSELKTDYVSYPGIESFSLKIKSYAVRDGEFIYLTLPQSPSSILPVESEKRVQPLYVGQTTRAATKYIINLPQETYATTIAPEQIQWEGPDNLGSISFRTITEKSENGGTRLVLERTADIAPSIIPVSDYSQLVEADDEITAPEASTIMIKVK